MVSVISQYWQKIDSKEAYTVTQNMVAKVKKDSSENKKSNFYAINLSSVIKQNIWKEVKLEK